jgi:hypothetical protein
VKLLAKSCEALGIACVMIGLVQGLENPSMWMELFLTIIGIIIFLVGWGIEHRFSRKKHREEASASSGS